MLLFTSFGFFSLSLLPCTSSGRLSVGSHARGDLDRLRLAYLPELGPSAEGEAGPYKWSATVDTVALNRALPLILEAMESGPFEDAVGGMLGASRASAVAAIASAWAATNDLPDEPEAEDRELPWSTTFVAGMRYGAVVIDTHGMLLMRHVPDSFDGYAWTFAKGKPTTGLSARRATRQIVREQLGVEATILTTIEGELKGSGSISRYFLMVVNPETVDLAFTSKATDRLTWANETDARALIAQTSNESGRERDLAVLELALAMLPVRPPLVRPIALRGDWKKHPMAATRLALDVQGIFSTQEMARVWRGHVPQCQEEKWFVYYEDDVLHAYRSWTGWAFFRIYFQRDGTRWSIRRCEVTQHPLDNANDSQEATELASTLLRHVLLSAPDELTVDPMVGALQQALSPNYLGSPPVVEGLLNQHLALVWERWMKDATIDLTSPRQRLARVFAGLNPDYTAIGVWNGSPAMTREVADAFQLEIDETTTAEVAVNAALVAFERAAIAWWDNDRDLDSSSELLSFARSVLMGARSAFFPDRTIAAYFFR